MVPVRYVLAGHAEKHAAVYGLPAYGATVRVLPAGHAAAQALAPAALCWPLAQVAHTALDVAPEVRDDAVPAGQGVHAEAPAADA